MSRQIVRGAVSRVRHAAIKWAAARAYRAGAVRMLKRAARRGAGTVRILVYHRVNNDRDPFFRGLPVEAFARQMEFLVTHFTVRSLEAALDGIRRDDGVNDVVVVTFDDGYMDNFVNAFPVLRRLSIPATIFLATDAVGTDRSLWHDRVFAAFRETSAPTLKDFGVPAATYSLRTVEDKLRAQASILEFLRRHDTPSRSAWIERLTERLQVEDRRMAPDLMLRWQEVRSMQAAGISFGSHSVTHPILSRVTAVEAEREIVESKRRIEECLGVEVRTFAYPNGRPGDFDETTKRLLQNAGYTCAVTTTPGMNTPGQDPFELKRGQPWDEDTATFALKFCLSGLRSS